MINVQINSFPTDGTAVSSSLSKMDILIELENACYRNKSCIADAIRNAIYKKTPLSIILNNIKEMAEDNKDLIISVIGESLTLKILAS